MDLFKKKSINNDHGDSATYFNKVLASNNSATSAFSTRKTLLLMVEDLVNLVSRCKDATALNTAKTHIGTAITVLHSLPCSTTALPIKLKIPPNSNNETVEILFN